jgi:hypothetical protein
MGRSANVRKPDQTLTPALIATVEPFSWCIGSAEPWTWFERFQ